MAELWFWQVALLFTGWAVLDGFDFGVGVLHRIVATTDRERREVIGAIGPVWDGNEVWLIAAGGSMFLAFPKLIAGGLSGFYLPVIFMVWALILRGASIELRSHLSAPLWRSFFDTTFMLGSVLVPILAGAALGNVLRGVPLDARGFFELPLFGSGGELGVLDGYTLLCAAFVLVTLTAHGANWLVWKTSGDVQRRSSSLRPKLWVATLVLWLVTGFATTRLVQFSAEKPAMWVGVALAVIAAAVLFVRRAHELHTFLAGCLFIVGQLVTAVGSMFPTVLRAVDPTLSLTVQNASSRGASMGAGLVWWLPGILLASGYLWWVLRHFRGKVVVD